MIKAASTLGDLGRHGSRCARLVRAATAMVLAAIAAHGAVLWSDPAPRLIQQNGVGGDILHGAVKPQGDTSSSTLYFRFRVDPLACALTERGTQYLAGVVFYQRGVERLGIGNAWQAWGYSAFHVPETNPGNMTAGELDLHSANEELDTPMRYEAPRKGVPRTFVFRVQYVPGGNDLVTVWLNPDLAPGSTEVGQPTNLITQFKADASFDELRLCHRGAGGGWRFSDLAVATSFEDFVAPHLWQRVWVVGLAALMLVVAIGGPMYLVERRRAGREIQRLKWEHTLDQERARIARDLHDDLGTSITRIAWLSELAAVDKTMPEKVEAHSRKIANCARQMVTSLDEIVWALNPRNDTLQSLVQYVTYHANETFDPTPVNCRLAVSPDLPPFRLSSEARHNLFLAVKEGLNNILKHAAATEAHIRFVAEGSVLTITVEDNGRGFDPKAPAQGRQGHGLANLRRRIEGLGGTVRYDSVPGQGTRLSLLVKLGGPKTGPL